MPSSCASHAHARTCGSTSAVRSSLSSMRTRPPHEAGSIVAPFSVFGPDVAKLDGVRALDWSSRFGASVLFGHDEDGLARLAALLLGLERGRTLAQRPRRS